MSPLRIAYVDGPRLRRTLLAACGYAQRQRAELNRINVFPVPDGDTGTNLALTLRSVEDHLRTNGDPDVAAVAREAAEAAVLGARGNCGMMLSHFLLGFAEAVRDRGRIRAAEFRGALRAGVEELQRALERPVEGTILTVMRESAEAATDCPVRDFVPLVEHVVDRAKDALARTPELLPVLAKAGVVDAGAKGWVSLLEGVLLFIHGDPLVASDEARVRREGRPGDVSAPSEVGRAGTGGRRVLSPAAASAYGGREESYRYCTEALVRGPDLPDREAVTERLRAEGDSLIVIRSGDILKLHVHTDDPEGVFAYLREVGTLVTHKAEDMEVQHDRLAEGSREGPHVTLARRPATVVTDSSADLPEEVVRAHGIQVTPLVLVDDGKSLRDGVDVSAEEFHRLLTADEGSLPTTSQPAPADFLSTFESAAEDGEEVLGVILGSALSGTFGSAEAAAGRLGGTPVHLVDSRGASLLTGLLVLKAAELVEDGTPPERAAEIVRDVRDRSGILFTVDSFDRLLASGRVGKGRAFLGSVLNVKPILEIDRDGRVQPVDRVVGRSRALPAVLAALDERVPKGSESGVRFGVVHVAAPRVVPSLCQALRSRWGRDVEILTAPATPVIATHLGPGAWGVAYMVE